MSDAAEPALSRRRLFEYHWRKRRRSGRLSGDDLARIRRGIAIPRSDQARRRPQGSLGHRSWRRARRNDDGDRARARRLQSERAGVQRTPGRAELEPPGAATSTRSSAAPRKSASSTPASISIPGLVHPLPSLRDPGLLPPFRPSARALHPAQPQRLFAFRQRVRRQAAAHSRHQGRLRWRRRGASRQGCKKRRAGRRGVDGRSSNPARSVAVAGRARQGLPLSDGRGFSGSSRLWRSIPAAVSARRRWRASRLGCTIS